MNRATLFVSSMLSHSRLPDLDHYCVNNPLDLVLISSAVDFNKDVVVAKEELQSELQLKYLTRPGWVSGLYVLLDEFRGRRCAREYREGCAAHQIPTSRPVCLKLRDSN